MARETLSSHSGQFPQNLVALLSSGMWSITCRLCAQWPLQVTLQHQYQVQMTSVLVLHCHVTDQIIMLVAGNINSGQGYSWADWALGPAHCWHRFDSLVWQRIFVPSQLSGQHLLWCCTTSVCSHIINTCLRITNPKHWQPCQCLVTWKYRTHTVKPWRQNVVAQVAE